MVLIYEVVKKFVRLVLLGMIFGGFAVGRAGADGLMVHQLAKPVVETGQKAVIWYENNRETMILSTTFRSDPGDMVWIIPVPSKPEVKQSRDELFTALEEYTRPKNRANPIPVYSGATLDLKSNAVYESRVTVVETKRVDIYDVAILESTDGKALREWLQENGFEYPATKDHLLQYYVNKGWYFVAAKINVTAESYVSNSLQSGHATPLEISFDTDTIIYPLKISGPAAKFADGQKIAAYSFETGQQGWGVISGTGTSVWLSAEGGVVHGKNSLQVVSRSGADIGVYQVVSGMVGGKSYQFSAYVSGQATTGAKASLRVLSGANVITESTPRTVISGQPVKLETGFVANGGSYRFEVVISDASTDGKFYIDGVQIEQGSKATDFDFEVMPGIAVSDTSVDLILYVFSDHKKTATGFKTEYAGKVSGKTIEKMSISDDGEPWRKTSRTMYLTRLTRTMRTSEMVADVVIKDADDNSSVGASGVFFDNPVLVWTVLVIPLIAEVVVVGYLVYKYKRRK